jgi:hypothetical protein
VLLSATSSPHWRKNGCSGSVAQNWEGKLLPPFKAKSRMLLSLTELFFQSEIEVTFQPSSKYPGIDFFRWNPADSKNILLAVQVTAQESLPLLESSYEDAQFFMHRMVPIPKNSGNQRSHIVVGPEGLH